jgi:hypothetical protein
MFEQGFFFLGILSAIGYKLWMVFVSLALVRRAIAAHRMSFEAAA